MCFKTPKGVGRMLPDGSELRAVGSGMGAWELNMLHSLLMYMFESFYKMTLKKKTFPVRKSTMRGDKPLILGCLQSDWGDTTLCPLCGQGLPASPQPSGLAGGHMWDRGMVLAPRLGPGTWPSSLRPMGQALDHNSGWLHPLVPLGSHLEQHLTGTEETPRESVYYQRGEVTASPAPP